MSCVVVTNVKVTDSLMQRDTPHKLGAVTSNVPDFGVVILVCKLDGQITKQAHRLSILIVNQRS